MWTLCCKMVLNIVQCKTGRFDFNLERQIKFSSERVLKARKYVWRSDHGRRHWRVNKSQNEWWASDATSSRWISVPFSRTFEGVTGRSWVAFQLKVKSRAEDNDWLRWSRDWEKIIGWWQVTLLLVVQFVLAPKLRVCRSEEVQMFECQRLARADFQIHDYGPSPQVVFFSQTKLYSREQVRSPQLLSSWLFWLSILIKAQSSPSRLSPL